jgi:mono/diheme cytochrome c family protein
LLAAALLAAPTLSDAAPDARSVQVTRGRYLVKTTGCNDCHTVGYVESEGRLDESRWLTGSPIGWQGPWGTTYAVNLRLFVQDLTPEEWLQVARRRARPPMPWFALRDMTDEDLLAIYRYVRSLGPGGAPAPTYAPPGAPVRTQFVRMWPVDQSAP